MEQHIYSQLKTPFFGLCQHPLCCKQVLEYYAVNYCEIVFFNKQPHSLERIIAYYLGGIHLNEYSMAMQVQNQNHLARQKINPGVHYEQKVKIHTGVFQVHSMVKKTFMDVTDFCFSRMLPGKQRNSRNS